MDEILNSQTLEIVCELDQLFLNFGFMSRMAAVSDEFVGKFLVSVATKRFVKLPGCDRWTDNVIPALDDGDG